MYLLQSLGAVVTKRNSSGYVIEISGMGPQVMEALSQMLGFRYKFIANTCNNKR